MPVVLVREYSEEIASAMSVLVPQLSQSAVVPTREDVQRFIQQDGVYLFVFRHADSAEIVGMLTLATFEIPTGLRAWIEDVVVLETARGQGAGAALVQAALEYAGELGARTVDLTSRPSREAANRLYVRCGFELRQTNVYRAKA